MFEFIFSVSHMQRQKKNHLHRWKNDQNATCCSCSIGLITRPAECQIESEGGYCCHAQILLTAEGYTVNCSLYVTRAFTMMPFFSIAFSLPSFLNQLLTSVNSNISMRL